MSVFPSRTVAPIIFLGSKRFRASGTFYIIVGLGSEPDRYGIEQAPGTHSDDMLDCEFREHPAISVPDPGVFCGLLFVFALPMTSTMMAIKNIILPIGKMRQSMDITKPGDREKPAHGILLIRGYT